MAHSALWYTYKYLEKLFFVLTSIFQWQWRLAAMFVAKPIGAEIDWKQVTPYGSYTGALKAIKMAAKGFWLPMRAIVATLALIVWLFRKLEAKRCLKYPMADKIKHGVVIALFYDIAKVAPTLKAVLTKYLPLVCGLLFAPLVKMVQKSKTRARG
ncbi:hypothetical protein HDE_13291 [Halotydeus destructor]|nr:hypothetical protein HDE_13291 [Halotydeus destructor]